MFLKEFLNEYRHMDEIADLLEERITKYEKKKKVEMTALYRAIKDNLTGDPTGDRMRAYINFIIERLYRKWWEKAND